ncbi:MAG: hypothetical protein RIA69_07850 [Cyclobacteriaceae bacterium]
MNRSIFHIVIALFLTLAVTDDIWINLLQDDPVRLIAELESEQDAEEKEELREGRSSETKHDTIEGDPFSGSSLLPLHNSYTGFVKHGNSYTPISGRTNPKLFILHRQLLIDC